MNSNPISSAYKRVFQQPAYILHSRAYQNTSLLVDAFTANYGRIRFVAKGARRLKSAFAGKLQVFTPLLISWSGKGDLYTLNSAELASFRKNNSVTGALRGSALISAYYLNELLIRFVSLEDPHSDLFYYYVDTLDKLFYKQSIENTLRNFEKWLLEETGYSLVLTHDARTGKAVTEDQVYLYDIAEGPRIYKTNDNAGLQVSGKTLIELDRGSFSGKDTLRQAKQLMRMIIASHLGDKPLKTRKLFQTTIL